MARRCWVRRGKAWCGAVRLAQKKEVDTMGLFGWKISNGFSADTFGQTCEEIEARDGSVTKEALVEAARPEDSPTHTMYEWRDDVAAEAYRMTQAHGYIRNLVTLDTRSVNGSAPTRAFVNVAPVQKGLEGRGCYINVQKAIEQPDTYAIMLERAKRQLTIFREQYEAITELAPVMDAIDDVMIDNAS